MITYKIYNLPDNFKEIHEEHFSSFLRKIIQLDLLSSSINEIIITDELEIEIESCCADKPNIPFPTVSREFRAIGKIVNFDGIKKIFYDAKSVNIFNEYAQQIFTELLLEVKAEDILDTKYKKTTYYSANTPLNEICEILLSNWISKELSKILRKKFVYNRAQNHTEVRVYTDTLKRNVKKIHYTYQKDQNLTTFWFDIVKEINRFICRCLDVKCENGNMNNLAEFKFVIPKLLAEIEKQVNNFHENRDIEINKIENLIREILEICFIKIKYLNDTKGNYIDIIDNPKKIFKDSIIDTEPRIVAFIDILGFSAIIEEYDSDESSNLLNDLHDTLEIAIKSSIENMKNNKIKSDFQEDLEYRMFSDCICISIPYIEYGDDFHSVFHSLAFVIKSFQLAMMQKGFFVRGGISMGSYFADKNMIFSGGLVNAYKIETQVKNPIIAIDEKIKKRLEHNYEENVKGFLYDGLLIYNNEKPEILFLNPFDLLDNSSKNINYLQENLNAIIEDYDNSNIVSKSLLEFSNLFSEPFKSLLSDENINLAKEEILNYIQDYIHQYKKILEENINDEELNKSVNNIISKYDFMENLIQWTMKNNTNFSIYDFNKN